MSSTNRYADWLAQAEDDYLCAVDMLESGHYPQVCFLAQQGGEKAIKALAFFNGASIVKSHSILSIARALNENGELEKAARNLDRFYISARYPDAYPEGYPAQYIDKDEAYKALNDLNVIVTIIRKRCRETAI